MSSNYSWRPRTKKSGVTGNRVLLGLRKLLQCGNSKQTIHSESKSPSPISIQKHRGKTKNGLDKGRHKEKLYGAICIAESISETTIRRCTKYGENKIQTMGCTVHGCKKKLINQKNCTMRSTKITELKTEEINKKLQDDQRSHVVNKSEGEQLEELCTMNAGAQAEFSTNNRRRNGKSSTKGLYQ